MKTKNIKVLYTNRYQQGTVVPKIQMEGKWLETLGFSVGMPLIVEYAEGSITIRLSTAEEQAAKKQQELKAELSRREAELKELEHIIAAKRENLSMVAEPLPKYTSSQHTISE